MFTQILTTLCRYLLDHLLSALEEVGLYEKPLQHGYVRLKLYCICGKEFITDYPEADLDGVQQLQTNYLDAGFEAKVFAYQRRDGTTDLGSNMNTQLENEEGDAADHSQTEAVDLLGTGSTTCPDSRKVSNKVGQEDRHGSTSQVNEGWMRHVEQFIAKPGDQHV